MLEKPELKEIGKKALAEMFGIEFVKKYGQNICLCMDRVVADEPFSVVATADTNPPKDFRIGDESESEYVAFVTINPKTGEVYKDYFNSRLPQLK